MSIYHIFVINRAGSLIFEWENKSDENIKIEKTFAYPLDIHIEMIDSKPTVVFGERDGIRLKYIVNAVNGQAIRGSRFISESNGEEQDFFEYVENVDNFPIHLAFVPPVLSANDKIIIASTFHSLYAIAAQVSPTAKSSGIKLLETTQFRLHCFQSITGIKFIVVASTTSPPTLDIFLRKVYELYADFALKNPFYSIDMPIRCDKFDEGLKALLEKQEKSNIVTL
uniref:Trafficking protein particle complex subunit n=1 Tax=Panagrolaimus sp. PS1159 TaxID=55785 RepID=A0AC35FGV9_9BILA